MVVEMVVGQVMDKKIDKEANKVANEVPLILSGSLEKLSRPIWAPSLHLLHKIHPLSLSIRRGVSVHSLQDQSCRTEM